MIASRDNFSDNLRDHLSDNFENSTSTKARKKKNISGWLMIDKPAGISSTRLANKLKYGLGIKKVGFAGTLDPAASGLLPIALGEATKTLPYIMKEDKVYHFRVKWGVATASGDAEGEIISVNSKIPSKEEILRTLPQFLGEIQQTPPVYSAIKINGRRACDRVRAGEKIDLPARTVIIKQFVPIHEPNDESIKEFYVECNSGTYVRSLAVELAEKMGTCAHIIYLRRTQIGGYKVENAVDYQWLQNLQEEKPRFEKLYSALLPVDYPLSHLPRINLDPEQSRRIMLGQTIKVETPEHNVSVIRVYGYSSSLPPDFTKQSTLEDEAILEQEQLKVEVAPNRERTLIGIAELSSTLKPIRIFS